MQRILNIYDWQVLPVGQKIVIKSENPDLRPVKIRVNAPAKVSIYLQQPDIVDPMFLARVEGLDDIRFWIQGDYDVFASDGEFSYFTHDGSRPDVEPVEPQSFTKIAERQARNPEMEIMELRMRQNAEARNELLKAAFAEELAKMRAELEADRTVAPPASTEAHKPDAGSVPPDSPVEQVSGATGGQSDAE